MAACHFACHFDCKPWGLLSVVLPTSNGVLAAVGRFQACGGHSRGLPGRDHRRPPPPVRWGCFILWSLCLVWADSRHCWHVTMQRAAKVGEASHPGPDDGKGEFWLGAINPTGLNGKAAYCSLLEPGIYGVSETHLSSQGISQFRLGLRLAKSPFAFQPGAPAPLRMHSHTAGAYTGVGFLSHVPQRALPHSWHQDLWNTARLQISSFFLQPFWIQGAVMYGFPIAPQQTAVLLDAITDRIVRHATGPRFILGDFNLTPEAVAHAAEWRSFGFEEVQTVAAQKYGWVPRVTCKAASRKDMIWVSSELRACLTSVEVLDDWFPDHSVLRAKFQAGDHFVTRFVWPRPARCEVDVALPTAAFEGDAAASPRSRYEALWHAYEERLSCAKVQASRAPLTHAQRGRGRTLETKLVRVSAAPCRKARDGDFQPEYYRANIGLAQWTRQVRRLQAYCQAFSSQPATVQADEARVSLWKAILSSSGFHPSFAAWWASRPVQCPGEPVAIPVLAPAGPVAQAIFAAMQTALQLQERALQKERRSQAASRRASNPSLLFRDLRPARSSPVQTLVEGPQAKVCEVRREDGCVVLESPALWLPEVPFVCKHCPVDVHHAEPDCLYGDVFHLCPGDTVEQRVHLAALPDLFRAFSDEWSKRWVKVDHFRADRWAQAVETFPALPACQMAYAPITVDAWRRAVRAKSARSGPGPDGVARQDLLALPDDLVAELLALCELAEGSGSWPPQMLVGLVTALEKVAGASAVQQYRPITVFSFCYRTWSSIRAQQCLLHIRTVAPPELCGGLPGREATAVWWRIQQAIEAAHCFGHTVAGVGVDIAKAFNTLPRTPVYGLAVKAGLPDRILRGWMGAVAAMTRRFQVRGSTGPPLVACVGFPEGCGMSVLAMALVDLALHHWVKLQAPGATTVSFVDDWQCLGPGAAEVGSSLRATEAFAARWDLRLDPSKTQAWSTSPAGRQALRSQGLQVVPALRDLGGHVVATRRHSNFTLVARVQAVSPIWHRLQISKAPLCSKSPCAFSFCLAQGPSRLRYRGIRGCSLPHSTQRRAAWLGSQAPRGQCVSPSVPRGISFGRPGVLCTSPEFLGLPAPRA